MRTLFRLLMLASFLTVAGCANVPVPLGKAPPEFKPDKSCSKGGDCEIFVEPITGWVPKNVSVAGASDRSVTTMVWNAFPFVFQGQGIEFDARGGSVFRCHREGAHKVVCANNGTIGDYKYTIDIWGVRPIDPWVLNR